MSVLYFYAYNYLYIYFGDGENYFCFLTFLDILISHTCLNLLILPYQNLSFLQILFTIIVRPTGNDYETSWYGSYSPGYDIYNPGNTISLRYEGTYNDDGFQLVYFQADPGKPIL